MSAPTNAPVLASDVLAWVTPCVDGSGLARVVRVVAVDDAMVERVADFLAQANSGKPLSQCSKLQQLTFREQAEYALRVALTPPEA